MYNTNSTSSKQLNVQSSLAPVKQMMLDLHGQSLEQAEQRVKHSLSQAAPDSTWRFVTGRGNHINKNGKRGVIFSEFENWINNSAFKDRVLSVTQYNGFYEVKMKDDKTNRMAYFESLSASFNHMLIESNLEQIIQKATDGDAEQQDLLATCYYYGHGVKQDYKKAVYWYEKAAQQNHKGAMFYLGICFWVGRGIRQNDQKGIQWLEASAKQHYAVAELQLGDIYRLGAGVPCNLAVAVSYYAKAAKHGSVPAMRKLADYYSSGVIVKQDAARALDWYTKAADLGDAYSQYNLAVMYRHGQGVEKNEEKAFQLFEEAAKNGDLDAQCIYGHYLLYKKLPINEKDGLQWLTNAANHGNGQASYILYGFFKAKEEHEKASGFLQKAIEANYIMADYEAAIRLGTYDEAKLSKLLAHYDHEIMQLDVTAKYRIIDLLIANDSTKKEKAKGLRLLNTLADEYNCEHAQARLGLIYVKGTLVKKKNEQKALFYWRSGAKKKHITCLEGLAHFHLNGTIVKQDEQLALTYFTEAANYGSFYSANLLGQHYLKKANMDGNEQ